MSNEAFHIRFVRMSTHGQRKKSISVAFGVDIYMKSWIIYIYMYAQKFKMLLHIHKTVYKKVHTRADCERTHAYNICCQQ